MVFSNAVFLFVFLPVVITGCYLLKWGGVKYQNYWLLIVSIIFYAWNKPEFTVLLVASIFINYSMALLIEYFSSDPARKTLLWIAVIANIGLLFYFKYFNFTIYIIEQLFSKDIRFNEIILPIGISFFTFQGLSYVIDVYREEVPVQKNIFKLGMYISMFPQLVAGPIVRYKDVAKEIDNRTVQITDFSFGIQYFILGLFKKVMVADTMAIVADSIFCADPYQNSIAAAWLGIIAYSLQIFFDFSGYSDMAIGLGRMFGFHFTKNFHYPYMSKSITEFWRRWHISLSSFFRDYVYIPLGGNRHHMYFNIAVVFLLTGIWHGAAFTYIIWGVWHGTFNIIEKNIKQHKSDFHGKYYAFFSHIYTLGIVLIGWIIFRSPTINYAIKYILSMIGLYNTDMPAFTIRWYMDKWTILFFALGLIMSTPIIKTVGEKIWKLTNGNKMFIIFKYTGLLFMFIICIFQIASNSYSPFIYFQF